jgi:hypothetical protein
MFGQLLGGGRSICSRGQSLPGQGAAKASGANTTNSPGSRAAPRVASGSSRVLWISGHRGKARAGRAARRWSNRTRLVRRDVGGLRADVVFLDEFTGACIVSDVGLDPARGDRLREILLAIAPQAHDRGILKRGPAVGLVPLLPGGDLRGRQAARTQEPGARRVGHGHRLRAGRHADVKRSERRGGEPVSGRLQDEIEIAERFDLRVPLHLPDRVRAGGRALLEVRGSRAVALQAIGLRQREFEVEQQAIQVHRDQRSHVDRCERVAVGEPPGAEISAGFSARAQVAPQVARVARRILLRGRHVFEIRLVARRGTIIPVAVQKRASEQANRMMISRSGREICAAVHPIPVFLLQLGQVFDVGLITIL